MDTTELQVEVVDKLYELLEILQFEKPSGFVVERLA